MQDKNIGMVPENSDMISNIKDLLNVQNFQNSNLIEARFPLDRDLQVDDLLKIVLEIVALRNNPDYRNKIVEEVKAKITINVFEGLSNEEKKSVLDFLIDTKQYQHFCELCKVPQSEPVLNQELQEENKETFELEFIIKMYLHQSNSIQYLFFQKMVIFKEHGQERKFSLPEILKHANFEHINLDEFSQYKYLEKTGNLDLLSSGVLQRMFSKVEELQLTLPECLAIYQYTSDEYRHWNSILRGDLSAFSLLRLAGIAIAVSALKKLNANLNQNPENIVRFEKAKIDDSDFFKKFDEDVRKRESCYQQNLSYKGAAFSSFSTDPTTIGGFKKMSYSLNPYLAGATLFLGACFQSVAHISPHDESEVLLPPGKFKIQFFTSLKTVTGDEYFYSIVQFFHSLAALTSEQRKLAEIKPVLYSFNDIRWSVYNEKKSLTEFLNVAGNLVENKDTLHAIAHVKKILHTPYTDPNDLHVHSSWVLKTEYGEVLRPNHGLSHTLTVTFFVPWVVYALKNFSTNTASYKFFEERHIKILQLCMLFSVVGRENDVGWVENERLYKSFRQKSGELFEKYCLEHCMHLFESADEVAIYKKHLIDMGNPDNHDPIHVVINMCHKLQLLRCFNRLDLNTSIITYFKSEMAPQAKEMINALVLLSALCIRVTGDQMIFLGCPYDKEIFYNSNHNEINCWEQLNLVTNYMVGMISCAITNIKLKQFNNHFDVDSSESSSPTGPDIISNLYKAFQKQTMNNNNNNNNNNNDNNNNNNYLNENNIKNIVSKCYQSWSSKNEHQKLFSPPPKIIYTKEVDQLLKLLQPNDLPSFGK